MSDDLIIARYLVETPLDLDAAAAAIAGEQSTGTFVKVPGETDVLCARFAARVEAVEPLEPASEPSLPGTRVDTTASKFNRAEVTIAFPLETVGTNLTTLVSTVLGNLFELREVSGLRLLDLELPSPYAARYDGPQFGIDGTRRLTGVSNRPIVGTIIKPSVGLSPEATADLVARLADADIDFVKDDELMADPPHSPFEKRVEAVMRVVNEAAGRTGKKVMVAFNISDAPDAMIRKHDLVQRAGGTCVMVSLNSVGLAGVLHLRSRSSLPIHGHRNGWGMLTRCPQLGIAFPAYQKLWRLAGVDHIHVNGLANKFWEPDESVVRSIRACLAPLLGGFRCMPVISSGQWGGQAPETYRRAQSIDVMYLAGGGIMAHPAGPAAGVAAIRQAWAAAVSGVDLYEYALDHAELQQSLEKFGKR